MYIILYPTVYIVLRAYPKTPFRVTDVPVGGGFGMASKYTAWELPDRFILSSLADILKKISPVRHSREGGNPVFARASGFPPSRE